jgi:hypothetical protein
MIGSWSGALKFLKKNLYIIASKKNFFIFALLLVVVVVLFLMWYFSRFQEGASEGEGEGEGEGDSENNSGSVDTAVDTVGVQQPGETSTIPPTNEVDAAYQNSNIENEIVGSTYLGGVVTGRTTYGSDENQYTLTTIDGTQAGNKLNLKVGNPETGTLENESNNVNVYTWDQLINGHATWQNDKFNVQCNKMENNPNMVSCLKYPNGSKQFLSDVKVYKNSEPDSYSFKYENGYIQDQLIHNEST